jgi:RND superfamily putative drug exporter
MFTALGRFIVRRSRLVLFGSLVAFLATTIIGVGVFGTLSLGGFEDPDSESTRAQEILDEELDAGTPNLVLIVTADGGNIDSSEAQAAGLALTEDLRATEGIVDVASYWELGSPPPLRSEDGAAAMVFARADGEEDEQVEVVERVVEQVEASSEADGAVLSVEVGGAGAVNEAIGRNLETDLALAESIAIPLTLLLLVVVFRGVIAALLPLMVGTMAIFGAFFVLWAISQVTDVSVFSINLVTALGLGLAIDYALLMVSRFREELAAGRSVDEATVRTVESAGRTVAFSGLTVAVAMAALVIFPLYFLRSFAYAGVGVLLVAMAASIITLPAVLHRLGHRVNALPLPGSRSRARSSESPFWRRLAEVVLKRPAIVAVTVVGFLVLVGLPFLNLQLGAPDARVLPSDDPARVATERLDDDFGSDEAAAFPITISGERTDQQVDAYAAEVSAVDHIGTVATARGTFEDGQLVADPDEQSGRFAGTGQGDGSEWMEAAPDVLPLSSEADAAVEQVRAIEAPFEANVTGETARLIDTRSAIFGMVPWAIAWIAGATFVLLFLMFGSFLVPAKAIVLNFLSLTATFGAMVWIFQEGNLSGLLDFTATGFTDASMPILMFAIAFGLSMDYEVFLLSRIKEEHDRGADDHEAIVGGLAKTGRIVTAAALVLSITFFAFATSGITFMKLFGLGLAIAVLVDAFIVRATLVPALMSLAGSANWWAPAWAKRIHERFGIEEGASIEEPDAGPSATDDLTTERDEEPALVP